MTRTTTANTSRRPASAMIALGLTLTAANLMANRITGYSFEAYDSLIEARVSAISQKKNLFVLSGAPWCTYCNKTKTYIASLGADFNSKFVVYYADVSQNAEMSGRLPQYGTFDPRTIDTTYGWSASANSYLDSSGYSPGMIDRCIAEANKHSIGSITGLRLEGMEAVFPNSSAALVAKADFSDGKTMVFPASSITWSATGSASVGSDGVLSVGANASVGNAITVTAKFPKGIAVGTSDSAAKEMSVVSTDSVKSIDVDLSEVNLADSTDVRFKCIATFDNGKKGEIPASSWSVSFARALPYPDGTPLSALQTPRPVIDATGNLVYSTDYYYDDIYKQQVQGPGYSIGNHVLNVTANWGSLSHTKEVTVWGPSRAWISEMTLLTPAGALAPGEVIRLRCPKLSYTYGDKVIETDDSELFEFQALVNVDLGNSTVPATGDDYLVQRFGKMFIALSPDLDIGRDNTLDIKVYCRRKGSAYTGTDYDASLNTSVLANKLSVAKKVTASESVAAAIAAAPRYGNVNATWIAKYFPDTEITEDFLSLDSDGDGYSNGAEFTLGTDPTNKVSRFGYTAVHFDAHKLYYRLMWDELPGRTWKLQGKKTPFDAEWTDLERGESCDETAALEYHYFRVEADGAVHTHAMQDETLWAPPSWYAYDEASNKVTIVHDGGTDVYNPQMAVPEIANRRQLYKACTEAQRQIYQLYVWAWENRDLYYGGYKTYKLKIPLSRVDTQEAYNAFINDYPEAWAVTLTYLYETHAVASVDWVVAVTITVAKSDYDEKLATFNSKLAEWRANLSAKIAAAASEEEKMKVVFNASKSAQYGGTVSYDYNSGLATGISPAHTVYGGVVNKLNVCEGFAKTFAYLCHELGASDNVAVICGNVGTSGSTHVWNAVLVDGKWQEIDPTAGEWTEAFKNSAYKSHSATGVSAEWLARAQAGEYGGNAIEVDPGSGEGGSGGTDNPGSGSGTGAGSISVIDATGTGRFFVPGVNASTTSYDINKSSTDRLFSWGYCVSDMLAWYYDELRAAGGSETTPALATIARRVKDGIGNNPGDFARGVKNYINQGYMNGVIADKTAWTSSAPTAYTTHTRTSNAAAFSSMSGFGKLLVGSLYKGPAFVELDPGSTSTNKHAVVIWGAEMKSNALEAVYISDPDDNGNAARITRNAVTCEGGSVKIDGFPVYTVNAVTFLWAPEGISTTPPMSVEDVAGDEGGETGGDSGGSDPEPGAGDGTGGNEGGNTGGGSGDAIGEIGTDTEPGAPDSDYTGTFFVTGVNGSGSRYDFNKTGSNDSNLCWAFTFSNMMAWYQDMYSSVEGNSDIPEPRSPSAILAVVKGQVGNAQGTLFRKGLEAYVSEGYLLPYINMSDWTNPLNVKAYHVYDWSSTSELKSLAGFSRLLLENLYRAPAFMELLYSTGTGGHAVGIWGAEFEGGLVKAVYISDSDDTKTGYARHTVSCSGDRIIVDGYWAPRVNGLTFLYAPQGVGFTVPKNASAEPTETDVTYTLGDKTVVTKKIPLEGDWMKRYLKKHQASELNDDARDSNNNGVSDKDEYLLGTDPDDENSKKLRITGISFDENGRPKIAHEPEGNSAVADITVQGAVSPAGPWETHSDSDTAHHFFRVIVTPK